MTTSPKLTEADVWLSSQLLFLGFGMECHGMAQKVSSDVTEFSVMPCDVTICSGVSCILWNDMTCYVMLCYAMLSLAMICYIVVM